MWTRLAYLALLAFSSLTFADSVDYQAAGTLANHTAFTVGAIAAGKTWEVGDRLLQIDDLTIHHTQTGNLGVLDVTTGTLFACSSGWCFKGGTLDIDNLAGADIFLGKIVSGTISRFRGSTILNAVLSNGAATVIKLKGGQFSTQALIGTVPEPATLILLGTGLVGLGFMRRRALRTLWN